MIPPLHAGGVQEAMTAPPPIPKAEAVPRPYSIEAMVEAIVRLTYSPSKDL